MLVHLIFLSPAEKRVLEGYAETSPLKSIRFRSHAILMRGERLNIDQIARLSFCGERTITRWIKDYTLSKLASIYSGHINNENAGKLTRDQKQEVKELLSKSPNEFGIPEEFWSVPKLKEYVSAHFSVVYESDQSYHFLLKFSNLSFKYPDKLSPRRNEMQIQMGVAKIREEIKPLLADPECVVLASDETRLQLETEIRKTWLVKGKRSIVKTQRSDEHQNYLGFLDQRHGCCQVFEIEHGNQEETIKVLEKLLAQYPNKKVCVVWDNAAWHKGKLLRSNLSKGKSLERLHLINFPPYAPDHNPIEHVWQYAKSKISNRHQQPFADIKQDFLNIVSHKLFDYKI